MINTSLLKFFLLINNFRNMKALMANLMPNRGKAGGETAAWACCKLIFLLIGVASTVVFVGRLAVPYFAHLLSSHSSLPGSLCKSIAVPRYLFIAVNSIIIIVWKLHGDQHHHHVDDDHHETNKSATHDPLPPKLDSSPSIIHESPSSVSENALEIKNIINNEQADGSDNDQSSDPWPPPPDESSEDLLPENDTMDDMWEAIMGGGGTSPDKKSDTTTTTTTTTSTPTRALSRASAGPARRFVKSDTFTEGAKVASGRKEMRKSKTFRESSSSSSRAEAAAGWRGRDRLLIGQDELYNKAEAYIKMTYHQLRLQRQESEQRYVENMVNAAY